MWVSKVLEKETGLWTLDQLRKCINKVVTGQVRSVQHSFPLTNFLGYIQETKLLS